MAVQSLTRSIQRRQVPLLVRLEATRRSLLEAQRHQRRESQSWSAIERLIQDIEVLEPLLIETGTVQSSPHAGPATGSISTGDACYRSERGENPELWKEQALQHFAKSVLTKGRIGKFDVAALNREVLADGITSRREAEILIELDREITSLHFSWSAFFISTLTEFVVWRCGCAGHVDDDDSKWLLLALGGDSATDRGMRTLVRISEESMADRAGSSRSDQGLSHHTAAVLEFAA
jgi:hypothetical protein